MKNNSFFEALIRNWPAKIIAVTAAVLLFLFHRTSTLEERFFSVPLRVIENSKLIPAEDFPEKVGITVRGGKEGVSHILEEDIEASIDLSQFSKQGEYDVPVEVEKKGSALNVDPLEIRVEPLMIRVKLEKKVTKTLEVVPQFEGFPAHGYELEQYFITPTFVKVEGPESRVENMETVKTEKIDLTGKKDNFTVRVQIDYNDSLVRFPGGDVVEFHAIIQEAIILKTFDPVDIVRMDLSPDFIVVSGERSGSIKVQGSQLIIEKVGREQVRLVVDCSIINTPGTYTLPTKPDVPLGLLVLNYDPVEITIEVRSFEEDVSEEPSSERAGQERAGGGESSFQETPEENEQSPESREEGEAQARQ